MGELERRQLVLQPCVSQTQASSPDELESVNLGKTWDLEVQKTYIDKDDFPLAT